MLHTRERHEAKNVRQQAGGHVEEARARVQLSTFDAHATQDSYRRAGRVSGPFEATPMEWHGRRYCIAG